MSQVARNLSGANFLRGVFVVCVLFAMCSARTARADTWNYSGQAYNSCYGSYATTPTGPCNATYAVSGSLTTAGTLTNGWNYYTGASFPTSFSFTDDGVVTLTQSNYNSGNCDGCISLDYDAATNTITGWNIYLECTTSCGTGPDGPITFADLDITNCGGSTVVCPDQGNFFAQGIYDYTDFVDAQGGGEIDNSAGKWTSAQTGTVPEPSSLLLLGSGLLALGGMVLRRKQSVVTDSIAYFPPFG